MVTDDRNISFWFLLNCSLILQEGKAF